MALLLVKLTLAPALVIGASLAGRRFGPFVAGTIGGLPVVAGPVLLVIALEHGRSFAARAAVGVLLGLVALAAFAVVYALVSRRRGWVACLLSGWPAFLLVVTALRPLHPPLAVAVLIAALGVLAGARLIEANLKRVRPSLGLGTTQAIAGSAPAPPRWDLPLRALATVAMVLLLTGVAGAVGSAWSGLLTPFPVIGSILPVFAHAQAGAAAARTTLRGILLGLGGFVAFALVVALAERPWGTGAAFGAACAAALIPTALRARAGRGTPRATGRPTG